MLVKFFEVEKMFEVRFEGFQGGNGFLSQKGLRALLSAKRHKIFYVENPHANGGDKKP